MKRARGPDILLVPVVAHAAPRLLSGRFGTYPYSSGRFAGICHNNGNPPEPRQKAPTGAGNSPPNFAQALDSAGNPAWHGVCFNKR